MSGQLNLADLEFKAAQTSTRCELVPLNKVVIDPGGLQPDDAFCDSVRTHGVIEPILVNEREDGNYTIIAGRRRAIAAKIAGQKSVRACITDMAEWAPSLLAAAVVSNLQRKPNNPQAASYIDGLFARGADEEMISATVGIGKPRVRNRRSIWVNLIPPLQAGWYDGFIKDAVALKCSKLGKHLQEQLAEILERDGTLIMKDVTRVLHGGENATLVPEQPDEQGWRAKARTAAYDLEIAARLGAKDNTDAAQFLGRYISLLDEYGLRSIEFGSDDRVKADAELSDAEREFFGGVPGVDRLGREWRTLIREGHVDKGLTGALIKLTRVDQDKLLVKYQASSYVRENFDEAAIRTFTAVRSLTDEPERDTGVGKPSQDLNGISADEVVSGWESLIANDHAAPDEMTEGEEDALAKKRAHKAELKRAERARKKQDAQAQTVS